MIISALIGLLLIERAGFLPARVATIFLGAAFFLAAVVALVTVVLDAVVDFAFLAIGLARAGLRVALAITFFFAATRLDAVFVDALTNRFGAVFDLAAAALGLALLTTVFLVAEALTFFFATGRLAVLAAAFLVGGLALTGAFFLATAFDFAAVFDFVATFGFALVVAVLAVLRGLVEDVDVFFGALPVQGGVAPFNLDSAWVATAIKNSPLRF